MVCIHFLFVMLQWSQLSLPYVLCWMTGRIVCVLRVVAFSLSYCCSFSECSVFLVIYERCDGWVWVPFDLLEMFHLHWSTVGVLFLATLWANVLGNVKEKGSTKDASNKIKWERTGSHDLLRRKSSALLNEQFWMKQEHVAHFKVRLFLRLWLCLYLNIYHPNFEYSWLALILRLVLMDEFWYDTEVFQIYAKTTSKRIFKHRVKICFIWY